MPQPALREQADRERDHEMAIAAKERQRGRADACLPDRAIAEVLASFVHRVETRERTACCCETGLLIGPTKPYPINRPYARERSAARCVEGSGHSSALGRPSTSCRLAASV